MALFSTNRFLRIVNYGANVALTCFTLVVSTFDNNVNSFKLLYSVTIWGNSLEDIDECAVVNGGCQQRCINTLGTFHCECDTGYRRHADERTCIRLTILQ
ncbi:EGF-like and EMI domain-containing protein 1 [Cricetulus griseus]|nr:EGF-like and EMI domain-containing protein 1 [Cricetulus griseus]